MPLDLIDSTPAPASPGPGQPGRPGRRRDHSRDPEILDAAIEVLAEEGYDGMTMEMVAARAKAGKATLYRRWPSKGELVVDAVACMKSRDLDVDNLPDTGTLRGDLVAMIKPRTLEEADRKMQVMAGLMSVLSRSPELVDAINSAIVAPRAEVNRRLLERAIARGEISAEVDIATIALVAPSMTAYRLLVTQRPVDREYLLSIIDGVVLPAVGLSAPRA
ncbi:TetR/AcrR family transcriptional regulator [Herbiconiux sp. VKM Ac-1786]|uniref:TetR/AcrR family transcriptional regulator n=1 Tax=Herbiconiux sp. VKM Ac-1786 TaxID=2783824 RepID=UPI00188BE08A|nr:TetR/AcrR family transcriptional regulator [Herbiconiux sp. VKM Ac-1786]MBF4573876.1 TetR/AcrR family transcriptional regulator [Herbiconiux sp. VKM Ac-1786]